ncbi:MAG: HAD family hydrolase [Bacteroidales bacterium]|nr:HAD family hydrolase [Bacteroidales bacterium]MDD3664464.1 HAD family hydrolase [Bacteroidales bacterium]
MNSTNHLISACIFDFGGTLDTNGVHWSEKYWDGYKAARTGISKTEYEKAYVAAGDKMLQGIITPESTFRETIGTQIFLQLSYLADKKVIKRDLITNLCEEITTYCYNDVLETIRLAEPLLSEMNKRIPLALVSNFYGNIHKVLREFSIDKYFSAIIDSTVVNIRKPDPAIFSLAVKQLGLPPDQVIVIGDSYDRDIEAAKKAGCITVWLKGRSWREQPEGPLADYTINDINELKTILFL